MNLNAQMRFLISLFLLLGVFFSTTRAQNSAISKPHCQQSKQAFTSSSLTYSQSAMIASKTRSDTIDITNLTINLNITDFSGQTISGNCEVSITALQDNVSQLSLDLLAMNIDSITSGNEALSYTYNDTLLEIDLASTLNKEDSTVVIVYYNGSPVKDPSDWGGWYWQGDYAFNLGVGFESIPHNYGRVWFPCFDNFVERSTYTFNIITADGRNAKCNGVNLGTTSLNGDTIINHWRLDKTIPTYLASVAVSHYETVNIVHNGINGPVPIEIYGNASDTNNARASFANVLNAMAAFESGYGAYQWNKVGYSLVPFSAGAMEHATNIAYPRTSANGSIADQDLMAHELAHMWWGDLATCETAAEMWLNEGMATFSEYLFNESLYGSDVYRKMVRDNHESVIHLAHITDGGRYALNAMPLDITYGEQVYNKGSDVAHTLRGYMGDALFFGGLTSFLAAHKFTHMNSYMLRDHLSEYSGINLSDFFDKWVFNVGWPHFSIESVTTSSNGTSYDALVYVKQKLLETEYYCSDVPLEITFFDVDWSEHTETITASGLLSSQTFNIPFDPIYTAINYYNKISDAVSSDVKIISTPGNYQFVKNAGAHLLFTVNSITDSALIRVEHNWTHPDPIDGLNKYKLCPNRYWKIDGILPNNYSMTFKMFYDGREAGSSYYDHDLFSTPADHEDSLVVLYRADAGDTWAEWPYVTKNVIAPNDEWGQVEIDSFVLGEYVFALKGTMFSGSTFISNISHISCSGACDGSATVTADGGIGPYSYFWDDPSTQQGSTASGLCPGLYNVVVVDASGDSVIRSVNISQHDSLGGFATVTLETCTGCNDGMITFTASGGATPYSYQWDDPSNQNTITATGLSYGEIYTLVLSDANGCTYTADLNLGEGVFVMDKLDIQLAPNPTSGSFMITIKEPFAENTELMVTDINGRSIVKRVIRKGQLQVDIQTKSWESGIYLISIRNENGLLYSDKLIYTKD